jgi:hypothetical protein
MERKNGLRVAVPQWACLCSLFFLADMSGSVAQNMDPLKDALRAAGYQLYNPPRANWGPGFVFAGDIAGGRLTNVDEVCPNLYADSEAPQSVSISLPNLNNNESLSVGFGLQLLKAIFGINFDVDKVERERQIHVKWQNLRELSYTRMDQRLKNGEPRPITQPCRSAIENLLAKKRFADRLFVIVRAIAPESLVYDFSSAIGAQASASADVWSEAQIRVQGKGQISNGTLLEIKERMFVGYSPPFKLTDWLPTGDVSGEIVKVKGEVSNVTID